MLSFVERVQKDCGLMQKVVYMTPSTTAISDLYEKTNVEVKFGAVTLDQIIQFFGAERTRVLTDVSQLPSLLTRSRQGRPVWGFLLGGALLLLLFEGFFANRIAVARAARDQRMEGVA